MNRSNSAEGGTNGTTVTGGAGGNSGGASGDYFDSVTIGTGSALTFDNAQAAHGSLAYKIAPASSQPSYVEQTTQMGTVSTVYGRFYIYPDVTPASGALVQFRSGATNCARVALNPSSTNFTLNWKDGANVDITGTTTSAHAPQAWYRVEYKVIFSATVGQVVLNLYSGDSGTALDSLTSAATFNLGAASADTFRIGRVVGSTNTYISWLDDIVVNDTGFPGPAGSRAVTVSAAVGANLPTSGPVVFGTGAT